MTGLFLLLVRLMPGVLGTSHARPQDHYSMASWFLHGVYLTPTPRHNDIRMSDHRPVRAAFMLVARLRPNPWAVPMLQHSICGAYVRTSAPGMHSPRSILSICKMTLEASCMGLMHGPSEGSPSCGLTTPLVQQMLPLLILLSASTRACTKSLAQVNTEQQT
jgi:hypothetical protein